MPVTPDQALIERAQQGDPEAVAGLYRQHVQAIARYIAYRVPEAQVVEDLTAEVFLRMVEGLPGYRWTGAPFEAWLYRIAHNLVANWHRDNSRRPTIALEDLSQWRVPGSGPEDITALLEDRAALLEAVRRLPADRQELLLLKFVDQLSNAEIAGVMGRSEGAIKSLYHRTLLVLRQDLQAAPPRRSWRSLLRWREKENGA